MRRLLLVVLLSMPALACSLMHPFPEDYFSPNGHYRLHVDPDGPATLYAKKQVVWRRSLLNEFCPVRAIVGNDGRVATLGDWYVGESGGDKALVLYNRAGQPLFHRNLADLVPPLQLQGLPATFVHDPWRHAWLDGDRLCLHLDGSYLLVVDANTGQLRDGGKNEVVAALASNAPAADAIRLALLWNCRATEVRMRALKPRPEAVLALACWGDAESKQHTRRVLEQCLRSPPDLHIRGAPDLHIRGEECALYWDNVWQIFGTESLGLASRLRERAHDLTESFRRAGPEAVPTLLQLLPSETQGEAALAGLSYWHAYEPLLAALPHLKHHVTATIAALEKVAGWRLAPRLADMLGEPWTLRLLESDYHLSTPVGEIANYFCQLRYPPSVPQLIKLLVRVRASDIPITLRALEYQTGLQHRSEAEWRSWWNKQPTCSSSVEAARRLVALADPSAPLWLARALAEKPGEGDLRKLLQHSLEARPRLRAVLTLQADHLEPELDNEGYLLLRRGHNYTGPVHFDGEGNPLHAALPPCEEFETDGQRVLGRSGCRVELTDVMGNPLGFRQEGLRGTARLSPDGRHVLWQQTGGTARLEPIGLDLAGQAVGFTHDGRVIAIKDERSRIYDLQGRVQMDYEAQLIPVRGAVGLRSAYGNPPTIKVRSAAGRVSGALPIPFGPFGIEQPVVGPRGERVFAADGLHDPWSGRRLASFPDTVAAEFSPQGLLAVARVDGRWRLYDRNGNPLGGAVRHGPSEDPVEQWYPGWGLRNFGHRDSFHLKFSPDGRHLVTWTGRQPVEIRVWDLHPDAEENRLIQTADPETVTRIAELATGMVLSGTDWYEMDARGYRARQDRLAQLLAKPAPSTNWLPIAALLTLTALLGALRLQLLKNSRTSSSPTI